MSSPADCLGIGPNSAFQNRTLPADCMTGELPRDSDQYVHGNGFATAHSWLELPAAERGASRFIHLGHDALVYLKSLNRSVLLKRALEDNHLKGLAGGYGQTLEIES